MAVEVNSETRYTVSEIHDLANRYCDQCEDDDLIIPLALSGFIEWLEKREQVADNVVQFDLRKEGRCDERGR